QSSFVGGRRHAAAHRLDRPRRKPPRIKRKPRAGVSGTFFCSNIARMLAAKTRRPRKGSAGHRSAVACRTGGGSRRWRSAGSLIFAARSEVDIPEVVIDLAMDAAQRHLA